MSLEFLKECLLSEVINSKNKKFSWGRTITRAWKHPRRRFLFWWRIASYLYTKKNSQVKKIAEKINRNLIKKYNTEIPLTAQIQPGLRIIHYNGIVIAKYCRIGKNLLIRQNTTIGIKDITSIKKKNCITIGDNVDIGANSCIIGNNLFIGDNVTIGAMSFVNKDIPSNCIFYTKKENATITRDR